MQELIDEIKEAVPYFKMDIYQPNFNKALEKEKEQIMNDYRHGHIDGFTNANNLGTEFENEEDYYNQTYEEII